MPTSPRAVLHHKDKILCTFMHTTVHVDVLQLFYGDIMWASCRLLAGVLQASCRHPVGVLQASCRCLEVYQNDADRMLASCRDIQGTLPESFGCNMVI